MTSTTATAWNAIIDADMVETVGAGALAVKTCMPSTFSSNNLWNASAPTASQTGTCSQPSKPLMVHPHSARGHWFCDEMVARQNDSDLFRRKEL